MWASKEDILKHAWNTFFNRDTTDIPTGARYFFAAGTGVTDKLAIEFFKDSTDVIVVDRAGRQWRNGVLI